MGSEEFDFNFQSDNEDEKIELEWPDRDFGCLVTAEMLYKLKRRMRFDSFRLPDYDRDIRLCMICSTSNLRVEKKKRKGQIKAFVNECSYCNGPAIHYSSEPFSVNFFNRDETAPLEEKHSVYNQAKCRDCGYFLNRDEIEHDTDSLKPYQVREITVVALKRWIEPNVIDSHHIQYEDRHGRDITIPLCKDCHNAQQGPSYPEISPENIYMQDSIIYDEEEELKKRGS